VIEGLEMSANKSVTMTAVQREWMIKNAGARFAVEDKFSNSIGCALTTWSGGKTSRLYIKFTLAGKELATSWIDIHDANDLTLALDEETADVLEKLLAREIPTMEEAVSVEEIVEVQPHPVFENELEILIPAAHKDAMWDALRGLGWAGNFAPNRNCSGGTIGSGVTMKYIVTVTNGELEVFLSAFAKRIAR